MRGFAVALSLALAFAGCLANDADPPAPISSNPATNLEEEALDVDQVLESRAIVVDFEGRFTKGARVCTQTECVGQGVFEGETEREFGDLSGIITATAVRIEWAATSPGTQRLGVGIMTMWRECDDCEPVEFGSAYGPSPLTIDLAGLSVPLDERGVLHVYAYPLSTADEAGYVVVSNDQPFTVRGTVTLAPEETAN